MWDTAEHAFSAFGEDLASWGTLGRIGLAADVPRAEFYEVEADEVRSSGTCSSLPAHRDGPTAGRRGDRVLEDQLRTRLPSVGEEMIEAYVGRRLAGATLEVAFVSLWARHP